MTNIKNDFEYSCSRCQNPVDESDKYCKYCGADLSDIVFENEEQPIHYCEDCKLAIPGNYKYCNICGTEVTTKKVCKKCNYVFEFGGNYCSNCGYKS
jgi:RNA polymerase subunit RPABC4/transcription elongation factor Spt4